VTAGQQLVIDLTGYKMFEFIGFSSGSSYSGGDLYRDMNRVPQCIWLGYTDVTASNGQQLGFQTFVDPIPEPTSGLVALGVGLPVLAWSRRRRA
jgi:hypothetical protein